MGVRMEVDHEEFSLNSWDIVCRILEDLIDNVVAARDVATEAVTTVIDKVLDQADESRLIVEDPSSKYLKYIAKEVDGPVDVDLLLQDWKPVQDKWVQQYVASGFSEVIAKQLAQSSLRSILQWTCVPISAAKDICRDFPDSDEKGLVLSLLFERRGKEAVSQYPEFTKLVMEVCDKIVENEEKLSKCPSSPEYTPAIGAEPADVSRDPTPERPPLRPNATRGRGHSRDFNNNVYQPPRQQSGWFGWDDRGGRGGRGRGGRGGPRGGRGYGRGRGGFSARRSDEYPGTVCRTAYRATSPSPRGERSKRYGDNSFNSDLRDYEKVRKTSNRSPRRSSNRSPSSRRSSPKRTSKRSRSPRKKSHRSRSSSTSQSSPERSSKKKGRTSRRKEDSRSSSSSRERSRKKSRSSSRERSWKKTRGMSRDKPRRRSDSRDGSFDKKDGGSASKLSGRKRRFKEDKFDEMEDFFKERLQAGGKTHLASRKSASTFIEILRSAEFYYEELEEGFISKMSRDKMDSFKHVIVKEVVERDLCSKEIATMLADKVTDYFIHQEDVMTKVNDAKPDLRQCLPPAKRKKIVRSTPVSPRSPPGLNCGPLSPIHHPGSPIYEAATARQKADEKTNLREFNALVQFVNGKFQEEGRPFPIRRLTRFISGIEPTFKKLQKLFLKSKCYDKNFRLILSRTAVERGLHAELPANTEMVEVTEVIEEFFEKDEATKDKLQEWVYTRDLIERRLPNDDPRGLHTPKSFRGRPIIKPEQSQSPPCIDLIDESDDEDEASTSVGRQSQGKGPSLNFQTLKRFFKSFLKKKRNLAEPDLDTAATGVVSLWSRAGYSCTSLHTLYTHAARKEDREDGELPKVLALRRRLHEKLATAGPTCTVLRVSEIIDATLYFFEKMNRKYDV